MKHESDPEYIQKISLDSILNEIDCINKENPTNH